MVEYLFDVEYLLDVSYGYLFFLMMRRYDEDLFVAYASLVTCTP